ncbi:AI-2E family transporter [bacterium]|nr:MAG: AI-2E family transporter [bacterium]
MPGWRIALWAVLVLAALLFLWLVRGVLLPFVVSLIIAALLEPGVRWLRLRGMSRRAAVYLVATGFFGILIGAGLWAAPNVARQVSSLSGAAQDLTRGIVEEGRDDNFFVRWNPVVQQRQQTGTTGRIDQLLAQYSPQLEGLGLPSSRRALMDTYVRKNRSKVAGFVQGAFDSLFGVMTNLFSQLFVVLLVPLLVLMILLDMDNFRRRTPRWIPPAIRQSTLGVARDIGDVFFRYLRGISIVVAMYGLAQTALMLLMHVPYALLLGVLFAGLYLIPYLGNIVSAVLLLCVVGFTGTSGTYFFSLPSPWAFAGLVVGLYLAIGFFFDHYLYPVMVGNSVGLNPVISIFVILCGGALFGLPGMLVAFPLAGSVKVILDRILRITGTSQEGIRLPAIPLRHR